jgi:hypothetical protein
MRRCMRAPPGTQGAFDDAVAPGEHGERSLPVGSGESVPQVGVQFAGNAEPRQQPAQRGRLIVEHPRRQVLHGAAVVIGGGRAVHDRGR